MDSHTLKKLLQHPVAVKSGGTTYVGLVKKQVNAWKGIPYAQSTAGVGRFRRPVPKEPGGTVWALDFGPISPQHKNNHLPKSEDCLNLNIWSPKNAKRRPVLFYIHGGSLMTGTGRDPQIDGRKLAHNSKAVVVTFNYRLGVLGMLDFSFLDQRFTPNCGLLDVMLALRWTAGHIADFGGDPENITVMGASAGGSIASLLPMLPDAARYISKVVISSGVPTQFATRERTQELSRAFMKFMGVTTVDELMELSADAIGDATQTFCHFVQLGAATFEMTVDGQTIPEFPLVNAQRGAFKKVPMWIGMTRDEMSILNFPAIARGWGLLDLLNNGQAMERTERLKQMQKVYAALYAPEEVLTQTYSDLVIRTPLSWYAEEMSSRTKVWMYRLDWCSEMVRKVGLRAYHSSDIYYFFGNFDFPFKQLFTRGKESKKMVKELTERMQNDLVIFMENGMLPWENCGMELIGKIYDEKNSYAPVIPAELRWHWRETVFHQQSYTPLQERSNSGLELLAADPLEQAARPAAYGLPVWGRTIHALSGLRIGLAEGNAVVSAAPRARG